MPATGMVAGKGWKVGLAESGSPWGGMTFWQRFSHTSSGAGNSFYWATPPGLLCGAFWHTASHLSGSDSRVDVISTAQLQIWSRVPGFGSSTFRQATWKDQSR
jgi:hypothetical protein